MAFTDICLLAIILLLVIMLIGFMASGLARKPDIEALKTTLQKLRKSDRDRKLGGVCAGLGEHTPLPAWIWRAIFLGLIFFGGIGLVAYVILWVCMPSAKI